MTLQPSSERLPHWDLGNIYPDLESDAFRKAVDRLESQLDELDAYMAQEQIGRPGRIPEQPAELAATIGGFLDRANALLTLYSTLNAYVFSFVATNTRDTAAQRMLSKLDMSGVRAEKQQLHFRGWIGLVAEDSQALGAALMVLGSARDHAFFLKESAQQSRFLMSEAEEDLASELSLSGSNAWSKLQSVVTSQITVPFERDGKVEELPITVLQNLGSDPDEDIRRRAYEAELEAWKSVREPLAACLNGVKGTVNTLDQRRGRVDAIHSALDQARIDRETLSVMLEVMKASFPIFRRYWQSKATRLGKERLAWWDLQAPVGGSNRRYTLDEARELVIEQFAGFSMALADFARRAFEGRWIDAEPREGKVAGGFCMSLPAVEESRILVNYDGSVDLVRVVAHELGHAYHNECQRGKTALQRRDPMTLAETASIFCETIITDAALARAGSADEELAILESTLYSSSQVIVDIYSRFLFETEVFDRRRDAELSADDFCEIMRRCQLETYGTGLDRRYLNPYIWTWKPHYYMPGLSFYNFPYAFGLLFGLGLYAVYRERGPSFEADYYSLLRSTGEGTAAELAGRFGIDLRDPAFWEGSLQIVEQQIDRYIAL